MSVQIEGTQYALDPSDFSAGPVVPGSPDCVGAIIGDISLPITCSFVADDDMCLTGDDISGGALAILGDAFMKNYYIVFDYGNRELGIAKSI